MPLPSSSPPVMLYAQHHTQALCRKMNPDDLKDADFAAYMASDSEGGSSSSGSGQSDGDGEDDACIARGSGEQQDAGPGGRAAAEEAAADKRSKPKAASKSRGAAVGAAEEGGGGGDEGDVAAVRARCGFSGPLGLRAH